MANKKTVIEMYEGILANYPLNDEDKAFIEKRIEITRKKNANRGNGEPTPKQKEKMAAEKVIEDKILSVMAEAVQYSASDLVKLIDLAEVTNTQKLTPRLTALVTEGKVEKSTVKGRSMYSLVVTETEDEGD